MVFKISSNNINKHYHGTHFLSIIPGMATDKFILISLPKQAKGTWKQNHEEKILARNGWKWGEEKISE